jgi:hypothetical protein
VNRSSRQWRAGAVAVALTAGLALATPACGDDQPGYCSQLESVGSLKALAAAVAGDDRARAGAEMARFREVAADAPDPIHDDMAVIADALAEVVALGTTSPSASDTDLERRRDRANQQLASMTDHTAAVAKWAEEQCGMRLD